MILKGDCISVMKAMKPNSVDAIVTDPPYGLEFMGKEWDKLWDKREFGIDEYSKKSFTCSDGSTRKTNPVSRKLNNPNYKAGIEAQLWHSQWLIEAYRVLKPGGSMLVMGGTRTSHRLACAIEDVGFIIKDTILWLFGSGFPKCQDITPMIDGKILGITTKQVKERREKIGKNPNDRKKRNNALSDYGLQGGVGKGDITKPLTPEGEHWDGFKVGGIKPAYESIIWAVKPPEGSYVENVLKHGVGFVNVDECRVGVNRTNEREYDKENMSGITKSSNTNLYGLSDNKRNDNWLNQGRFPANIILSHHPECVQLGVKRIKGSPTSKEFHDAYKGKSATKFIRGISHPNNQHSDKDGYETVESWSCHPDCAVRLLDEQSRYNAPNRDGNKPSLSKRSCMFHNGMKDLMIKYGDSGGASRFFKQCNYGQEEWLCHEACALRQLDEQSGELKSGKDNVRRKEGFFIEHGKLGKAGDVQVSYGDNGGASRFYYCAKASRAERNAGLEGMEEKIIPHSPYDRCANCGKYYPTVFTQSKEICTCENPIRIGNKLKNSHPTVKPIKLFEWLIKLVTREGQIVLDPFIGSGTTIIAAHNAGRKCVGIEKEEEYIEIAKRRATHWKSQPKQMEMRV